MDQAIVTKECETLSNSTLLEAHNALKNARTAWKHQDVTLLLERVTMLPYYQQIKHKLRYGMHLILTCIYDEITI